MHLYLCMLRVALLTGLSFAQLLQSSVAYAQKPAVPKSPDSTTRSIPLPASVQLDFPLPGDPGTELGSILVERPGPLGRLEALTRAPGGPHWEELLLLKDRQPIFGFGFLLGVFTFNDHELEGRRMKDCIESIVPIPEKCTDKLLTFRMIFKRPVTNELFGGTGVSPVAYSEDPVLRPVSMNVRAIDISLRRGPVSVAYDPYELSLISERSGVHELTLFYVAAMRFPKSRRYLIDPNKLFQIMTTYKAVADVNEPTSLGSTRQKRFTAIANLINSEMATWEECLYDVFEPETDTPIGLMLDGATKEELSIPQPGKEIRVPRIVPQRIFRKVRLPVHELAMVRRLEAMKTNGASAEQIRIYRTLVNRVLLDRLMVDHWDISRYSVKNQIMDRGLLAMGVPDMERSYPMMGSEIPSYVPSPTEILRMKISIPKEVPDTAVKPERTGMPEGSKKPFVIPDDFNPLTHEVIYDKEGRPIGVRPKTP